MIQMFQKESAPSERRILKTRTGTAQEFINYFSKGGIDYV